MKQHHNSVTITDNEVCLLMREISEGLNWCEFLLCGEYISAYVSSRYIHRINQSVMARSSRTNTKVTVVFGE